MAAFCPGHPLLPFREDMLRGTETRSRTFPAEETVRDPGAARSRGGIPPVRRAALLPLHVLSKKSGDGLGQLILGLAGGLALAVADKEDQP